MEASTVTVPPAVSVFPTSILRISTAPLLSESVTASLSIVSCVTVLPVAPEILIDVIEGNRVYMPCLYVLNKIDQISIEELDILAEVRKLYEGDM